MKPQWLKNGMSFTQYLKYADMNASIMRSNFLETTVPLDCLEYFSCLNAEFPVGSIGVAVFSQSWCGDCVENVPVVARLAEDFPCFALRIFSSDLNLELMEKYLSGKKPVIPLVIFFSPDGEEIARFTERPEKAQVFMDRKSKELLGLSGARKTKAMYGIRRELRDLYKEHLRNDTIKEIRSRLEKWYGSKVS